MKRALVSIVLWLASVAYSRKRYATPAEMSYANLGCGLRCLPGWLNVDGSLTGLLGSRRFSFINRVLYKLSGARAHYSFSEYNGIIRNSGLLFYDLRNGVPFADNSLDAVYASHFLEHLKESDGLHLLADAHRALKRRGILRILVPDLDEAFAMYKLGKVDEMLHTFFYTSEHYDFHMHKYNYNFQTLSARLEKLGFRDITKPKFREGRCPGVDFLDLYENSLIVECRK